jgi:hypothetical protein
MHRSLFAVFTLTAPLCAQTAAEYATTARISPHGDNYLGSFTGSEFGCSIDVDGDRMLVGARGALHDFGTAQTFVRSGDSWVFEASLFGAAGGGNHAEHGYAVDLEGDEALIASPGWIAAGYPGGAVGVMQRAAGSWSLVQTLTPSVNPTTPTAYFGSSLARNGDRVLIGAPEDGSTGPYAGSVYVFEKDASGVWVERAKLVRLVSGSMSFGGSVALSGDTAVATSWQSMTVGNVTYGTDPTVNIYVRDDAGTPNDPSDDTWPLQQELTSPNSSDLFGGSIALDGDRLFIGVPASDVLATGAGAVLVYERSGATWTSTATLLASDGAAGDTFGSTLRLEGNRLLVGAIRNDQESLDSGKVYLFEYDGTAWNEVSSFVDSAPHAGEGFGEALAFAGGDRIVIGAPRHAHPPQQDFVGDGVVVVLRNATAYPTICSGDGTAGACPCGNSGGPGEGCRYDPALSHGGRLRAFGSNSIAAGELAFDAEYLPLFGSALLFGGTGLLNGGFGVPLGDGLRCVSAPIRRLGLQNTGYFGMGYWGPSFATATPWSAGETWRFQVWFRVSSTSSCGNGTSTTNGIEVTFAP